MSDPSTVLPQIVVFYTEGGSSLAYSSGYTKEQVLEAILNCALRHGDKSAPVQREEPTGTDSHE